MKSVICGVILLLIGAAVSGYWYWTRDRRQVENLLYEMVELGSKKRASVPHEGILKFAGTDKVFADPVRVNAPRQKFSRDLDQAQCRSMLALLHRSVESLTIDIADLDVEISGDQAVFSFDAEVEAVFRSGGKDKEIIQVTGKAVKNNSKWQVAELQVEFVINQ